MHAAAIQCLPYTRKKKKKKAVTLKQGKGHQTRYEYVDLKQGCSCAKF